MARVRNGRRLAAWAAGAVITLAVLVVGGTWLYIHVIEGPAPAPLSLRPSASGASLNPSASPAAAGPLTGTWTVARDSVAGYRVNEILAGQRNVAVGRTSAITGHLTISGTTVTAASVSVAMDTIKSDQSERDVQFNGRIMQTATYPAGTLTLSAPIRLGDLPASGGVRAYRVSARLTLHGQTRPVTFSLQAERTASGIEASGDIPVVFADFGISNPGFAGFVTVQNHGLLEFLVRFAKS